MELLRGSDAATLVEQTGPIAATQAVALLLPVLSGLAAAHAQGIVHRDLKPENIFLAEMDGGAIQPKIVDFGVARMMLPTTGAKLTSAGMLIGTPEFMAPEQVRCVEDVDGRADLWAFGVTLYHLIAGELPFAGDDLPALFSAILDAHVPFPTKARELDGQLWSILTDCLRRERDQRWQRAQDLEAALGNWLVAHKIDEDVSGRVIRPRARDSQSRTTEPEVASPSDGAQRAPSPAAVPGTPRGLDQAIFNNLKTKQK
jgi:serine/threonine-protein kinase